LAAPERADGDQQPAPGRRLTILLVENEVLVRFLAADQLRDVGHEVVEASDGQEALSLLEAGLDFDLVVTDIRMPGRVNGLQLFDRIRSRWTHIPVLLATSHGPQHGPRGVDYLAKPYGESQLLAAVQRAARPRD